MTPAVENIYNDTPEQIPDELFKTLFSKGKIKIEKIISKGHISKVDDWYDQAQDEWIILLKGQAQLQYKKESNLIFLNTGDYLLIPAHTKHRIHWTPIETETIWLAIHIIS